MARNGHDASIMGILISAWGSILRGDLLRRLGLGDTQGNNGLGTGGRQSERSGTLGVRKRKRGG